MKNTFVGKSVNPDFQTSDLTARDRKNLGGSIGGEKMDKKKSSNKCLECMAEIKIGDDTQKGEVITCSECSTDLEVVQVKPLKLALAPEVQEDWGQ
jgi:alpha-aminoadipate carrier protein LysW